MDLSLVTMFFALLYTAAGVLTMVLGAMLARHPELYHQTGVGPWWMLLMVAAVVGFVYLIMKRLSLRVFWELMFSAALFLGVWFASLAVLPVAIGFALAAALTILPFFFPRVVFHNLFALVGAVGVALNFAPRFTPPAMALLLVGMSVYDLIVAGPNGPLASMLADLFKRRVVPGFIIPATWNGWWSRIDVSFESHAAFLGAGDVILPMMLVAHASFRSAGIACFVLAGALAGLLVLTRKPPRHPRAALPWLAVGAAVPFLIFYALGRL